MLLPKPQDFLKGPTLKKKSFKKGGSQPFLTGRYELFRFKFSGAFGHEMVKLGCLSKTPQNLTLHLPLKSQDAREVNYK